MTDLITGGSGFIGRHLVQALAAQGGSVRVLDIDTAGPWPDGVAVVQGSITDAASVARAMTGIKRVFHLAAIPDLWIADARRYQEVNVGGTRTVLDAAIRAGVDRFVHCSSEVVFADPRGQRRETSIDERLDLPEGAMAGPYCASKWRAERLVRAAAADGFSAIIVNPAAPLGPGDRNMTPPTRLVADVLHGRLPAYLETLLNFVDVRDAAAGHILAAEKGEPGQRYILNGESLWLSALLTKISLLEPIRPPRTRIPYALARTAAQIEEGAIARLTGKSPQAMITGVKLARRPIRFVADKARTELGFQPRPFRETLEDAVAWLKATTEAGPQ